MAFRLLLWRLVVAPRTLDPFVIWGAAFVFFWGQGGPPPPPPLDGRPPIARTANHIADIRQRIDSTKAVNSDSRRALNYGRGFLTSAENALQSGKAFRADRLAEAAESLLHVAEHQQHLRAGGGPKGPPPADAIRDHLQHVYFRSQQADYFFRQSHDARAASLPQWARDFYQLAVRDSERNDLVAADENAKTSDEIVKALENLAQAANAPDHDRPGKALP